MQSDHNEKIVYKITPCNPLEPCFDLDDYDPCESGDDITEKDLAILLKEEKQKVEGKEELVYNLELQPGYDGIWKAGSVPQKEKFQNKTVYSETVQDRESDRSRDGAVENKQTVRKRICKKPIKNFFFTNRLKFSSDLPPPPPTPPPQFFPPAEETDSKGKIVCPKRRKKCKSKTDVEGKTEGTKKKDDKKKAKDEERKNNEGKTKDEMKDEMRRNGEEKKSLENEDDESFRDQKSEDRSERESERGVREREGERERGSESDGTENDSSEQEQQNKAGKTEDGAGWGQDGRGKRKCKKPSERPPCRKKLSEISLMLQPRHIPALQKDLPPTSPKDIPEVKRQILMGYKNTYKEDCRKKKSEKIKKLMF